VRGAAGAGATTSIGVEDPNARSKAESGAKAEPETEADTGSHGGIEVATIHVSKIGTTVGCRGAPLANTTWTGGGGSRGMEFWTIGATSPNCGPEIEDGTACSGPGASGSVPTEENACATSGANIGAPVSAKEGAHGTSVRTMPGKPVAGTEGDEDSVSTCTSRFARGNGVIVEA
jgi:hypothetical protein